MKDFKPGDRVFVWIYRHGKRVYVPATVGEPFTNSYEGVLPVHLDDEPDARPLYASFVFTEEEALIRSLLGIEE